MASTIQSRIIIIFTRESLARIHSIIEKYGQVGYIRVLYDREGNETDRTLVLVSDSTWKKLEAAGFTEKGQSLRISLYELRSANYPKETQSDNLCLPIPEIFQGTCLDTQLHSIVQEKLEHLAAWGVLPPDSWKISVLLKNRQRGEVGKRCFITFNDDVTLDQRAFVRLHLHDTLWVSEDKDLHDTLCHQCEGYEDDVPILRSFWAFPQKKKVTPPSKKDLTPEEEAARQAAREKLRQEKKRKLLGSVKPEKEVVRKSKLETRHKKRTQEVTDFPLDQEEEESVDL